MSDQTPTPDAPKTRKPPERTNPVVEFVSEIPGIVRGPGGFKPRSSKYDAVYAALKENPGRWAFIGEGDGLYGALTGYRKRRELDDMTIANRGGKVYAGVDIPEDAGGATASTATTEDANTPAVSTGFQPGDEEDDPMAAPDDDGGQDAPAETPQTAASASVPGDDGWA